MDKFWSLDQIMESITKIMDPSKLEQKTIDTAKVVAAGAAISSVTAFGLFYLWLRSNNKKADMSKVTSARGLLHTKYNKKDIQQDVDIIIIGSGMAGLSCGAILSRMGYKVLILEGHNDVCGGGTHMFDLKGYRFDSGLHYTVPWSVPLLALTTGLKESEVCKFDLMGEEDGTVDKIYLVPPKPNAKIQEGVSPFLMKYKETHIQDLYNLFPEEKQALNKYMKISNLSMDYVKVLIAARLFPRKWQQFYWKSIIPWFYGSKFDTEKNATSGVSETAQEILPKLTGNKKLISLLSSMWIDTGARPDKATFMLTAAVFRGVAMEGGCYPRGGSEEMAKDLVPVIESRDGKVMIRAQVKEIIIENGKAVGVKMVNGDIIKCSARGCVVSSIGYSNTMNKLVSEEVTKSYGIPRTLPVKQSAGFVMANIGLKASAKLLGITNTNIWHIPVDENGDCYPPLEEYFQSPLSCGDIPAFITFPSLKDKSWVESHPEKTTCQMLLMAEYEWFEEYYREGKGKASRAEGYETELKEKWKQKCLEILYKYYPKCRDYIEVADISTPLSIEQWLYADRGGAVGLDVTPERFTNPNIRDHLDCDSGITNLWMTGQDTVVCGVTLCQLAGVITAFRIGGFFPSLKIVAQSMVKGILELPI